MTYKTHIAFALSITFPIYSVLEFNAFDMSYILLLVSIGALAPDLDEEGSYLSRKIPIVPLALSVFGVKHRGITHQFIFPVFLFFALVIAGYISNATTFFFQSVYAFIFGWVLHVAGDMLTKGGVNKVLTPFSDIKGVLLPRKFRFYTNSIQEYFVFLAICIIIAVEIYFAQGIGDVAQSF